MQRFVILQHDWPFLHWDLMLEDNGRLRTWRILSEPQIGQAHLAEPSPDHRIAYLTYTGPVSRNRGSVQSWDRGTILKFAETNGFTTALVKSERFQQQLEFLLDSTAFSISPHAAQKP